MKYKKLSQYAKDNGISYVTAYRHFKEGTIENIKQLESGTILVGYSENENNNRKTTDVAIYTRVSSIQMKANLKRQEERLTNYAISKGYTIVHSISDVSSGMNDSRPKLIKLLKKSDYSIIIVEHKDRLTRFGFNYIETLLEKEEISIEVVNRAVNDNENLMEDLISIIYSFSARMYGARRSRKQADKIIDVLKK